jgi:4-amino-4-deoxy-L-arabinose transferase-like glycosyltransferase
MAPAGIVLLGTLLRLYHLGAWNLMLDEGLSRSIASGSLGYIWAFMVHVDPYHPPLSLIVLHFWRYLGDNEFTLRLLSVMLGVISIWMVYRIGAYLLNRRVGLLAAFILAISPFHIWYSQEARMYPALFLLSLFSLDALARLVREDRTWQWFTYVAATTLSLYTDYGAFLVLAAHNLAVAVLVMLKQSPRPWKWLLAQATIGVLYLPWVPALMNLLQNFEPPAVLEPTGSQIPAPFAVRSVAWILATFTSEFLPGRQPFIKIALILVFAAVCVVGIWAIKHRTVPWVLLSSVAVVPIAAALVLSYKTEALLPRTLIPASAGYYLLLANGLLALPRRRLGPLILGGLIAANMISLNLMYHHTEKAPLWSSITNDVASKIRPGEGVVVVDGRFRLVFDYYYHGPSGRADVVGYANRADFEGVRKFVSQRDALYLVLKDEQPDQSYVRSFIQSRFARTERTVYPGGVVVEHYRRI